MFHYHALARLAVVLLLPLMLASCVLVPGKFTATMTINADRGFAFSYVGEVWSIGGDPSASGAADDPEQDPRVKARAAERAKQAAETRNRAIAEALAKEAGYRRVEYLGDGRFMIDYAVKGTLGHAFVWPYNLDAELVFPFVAVELRPGGVVRMKAPAFAAADTKNLAALPTSEQAVDVSARLDGSFTLDTDAEIVSQNEESGVQTAGARRRVTWHATPALKAAPSAVLRLAPLL